MSTGPLLLTAGYVLLALLLLSLNLRSAWRWWVKAVAIVVTVAFFALTHVAIEALMGLPTAAPLPEHFRFHAAVVREPDPAGDDPGAIYLWLSPRRDEAADEHPPRAHALPYARELHEEVARAQAQSQEGARVEGERSDERRARNGRDQRAPRLRLYEAPAPALPPKSGSG